MAAINPGGPSTPPAARRYGRLLALLLLLTLIFLFWESAAFAPLRLLVVFFHEASHAVATWMTGGAVREMALDAREGGHVVAVGGNRFLVLNAGYLGSLLWGVIVFRVAAASRFDRAAMGVLGGVIAAFTIFLASGLFARLFGGATALTMLLAAGYLPRAANDFLLRLIGLTSMIYVPHDIYSDTIARSALASDARLLAREYGGATVLWGGVWLALSLAVILFNLAGSLRGEHFRDPSG